MTKGSDNDFPSILLTEQGSAPTSPAASHQRLYIRTSDHTLVTLNSSGTVAGVSGAAAFVGCKAYSSATQGSISASTMTKVTLNAEEYDTSTFHDNVTNNTRLTVPTTGYYSIKGLIYGSSTAGSRVVLGNFFKNNTTVLRGQGRFNESASGGIVINLTTEANLTASDYIEMRVWCSGADLTIGDATNIEQQCWMSATYLGS